MISFQSMSYYFFSFIVVAFFYFNNPNKKKYLLFVANVIFAALFFYFKKKQLVLLGSFVAYNYIFMIQYDRISSKKLLATIQIVLCLCFLFFFKYELFQVPLVTWFPHLKWFTKPAVFVGVSFFTFRLISMIFDTIYGARKNQIDFINFTNFLIFFPCYLSGPLDRYDRFTNDLNSDNHLSSKDYYEAFSRIILGAFKKGVIADSLYELSLDSFALSDLKTLSLSQIGISHYIYTIVLYLDFSGYSDIAIGTSRLFGIKTPENFNNPYFKRNIQDFWNSWHISFLHWLRDYIYIPIQKLLIDRGYRNFVLIACIAFFVVFVVAGAWHGESIEYVLYGVSHGVAFNIFLVYKMILSKKLSKEQMKKYKNSVLIRVIANLLTFHYFYFSLFFFIHKTEVFTLVLERLF